MYGCVFIDSSGKYFYNQKFKPFIGFVSGAEDMTEVDLIEVVQVRHYQKLITCMHLSQNMGSPYISLISCCRIFTFSVVFLE